MIRNNTLPKKERELKGEGRKKVSNVKEFS